MRSPDQGVSAAAGERDVVFIAGKDPRHEPGGGHSAYVRAHARAALAAGFVPHIFCAAGDGRTVATDFGVVHRVWSPWRPVRQLLAGGHAPWLAAAIERFARRRRGPLILHGFGIWGWAGVLARDRLRRVGVEAVPVVSSYTTYGEEARSQVRGSSGYGPARRLRHRAEHLWIRLAAERWERRAYVASRLVLVNYDSVRRLIVSRYGTSPLCRKVPYSSESAFLPQRAARSVFSASGAGGGAAGAPPPCLAALEPQGAPLAMAVSSHGPRKGIDVLLHALARLRAGGVPFRACLLGGGPLLAADRKLARDLGLTDSVAVAGMVADPLAFLPHADLFVLPSRAEQSGSLALIEALQAGLAIVASGVDGILEDVVDGEDALLVEPGDPAPLAAALARALTDGALRARLGRRARVTFAARFSPEVFSASLRRTYEELGAAP